MEDSTSPLSNKTDSSDESCIICLDSVDDKTIWFPSVYSSCSCKYPIHLDCIKENMIDKCIICNSNIIYPVSIQQIDINLFENEIVNSNTNIYDLRINTNIDTEESIQEESIQEESKCSIVLKKICAVTIGICLSSAFSMFIWYIVTT